MKISVFTHTGHDTAFFLGGGVALEYESDTMCQSDNENKVLSVYNFTEKRGIKPLHQPFVAFVLCCLQAHANVLDLKVSLALLCLVHLIRVIISNVKWAEMAKMALELAEMALAKMVLD